MRSRTIRTFLISVAAGLLMISSVVNADPPLESGRVIRIELGDAYTWVDFKTGYRVVIGLDILDFCNGPPNTYSVFQFQIVDIPTLEDRFVVNDSGYVPVQVFDFIDFNCAIFTAIGPVAVGMANFRLTDSDFFGTVETNDANAWGFNVHGALTDTSTGELRRLAATSRLMFNTQSDGVRAHSSIRLN